MLLSINTSISAKVYKWVDANGQTHYSDKKPENRQTTEVSINKAPKNSINNNQPESDDNSDVQDKLDDYAKQDKKLRKQKKRKKQKCNAAKKRLNEFKEKWTGDREYSDTGGYVYLSESEKNYRKKHYQEHIGNYQQRVKDDCR